ncbi:hypothetical protein HRbin28_02850 [bacterium HR28]|nr:hypothetical protein HRbin28_02850 [bacterium HR28]
MLRRDTQGNHSGCGPSGCELLGVWFFPAQQRWLRRGWYDPIP